MKINVMLYKFSNNLCFRGVPKSSIVLVLLTLFSSFFFTDGFANTKTFTGPGNFSDATKWNGMTLPAAGDILRINGTCTVNNSALTDNVAYGALTIGQLVAGTVTWAVGGTNRLNVVNVNSLIASSILNMTNGGTLIIKGTIVT